MLSAVTSVAILGPGIVGGNSDLNAGHQIVLAVNFDSAVTVDNSYGSPTLSLNDGATASYVGGTGTSTLRFGYTVAAGQNTSDLTVTAFNLNGASIQSGGVFSNLTGAVTNPPGTLQVDTTAPTATVGAAVQSVGNTLQYAVTFSELVTGVDANSFSLSTTGVTGASINSVTQGIDAAHYTVVVDSGSGGGTIGISINGTNIRDLAGNGFGGGAFVAASKIDLPGNARAVAIADLNGDGHNDLVTSTEFNSGVVVVQLGLGDGHFAPPTMFNVGKVGDSLAIADLNHDGKRDVVTANSQDNTVSVLLGDGTGALGMATTFAVGSYPDFVAIADVNGDNNLDLVTTNALGNSVSVLLGNGNGTFSAAVSFAVGVDPTSVAIADVNGDHKLDLVTANERDSTVSVLLGAGDGSFGAASAFTGPGWPMSVAVADVNGDGNADIVTANSSLTTNGKFAVSVLLGNGAGGFGAATNFAAGGYASDVVIADVNGDGKLDLVASDPSKSIVSVLLGTGTGNFADPVHYDTNYNPVAIAVGDVNGDGQVDIVTANRLSSSDSVLFGAGAGRFLAVTSTPFGPSASSIATGDINRDGTPDIVESDPVTGDLNFFLSDAPGHFATAFGTSYIGVTAPGFVTLSDINQDGILDLLVANTGTESAPGNTITVVLGTGSGLFNTPATFTVGSMPSSIAVGDVNGDGKPDLVVTNSGTPFSPANTVSVLLGTGNGGFQTATNLTVGTSPGAVAIADVNGDGKQDLVVADTGNRVVGGHTVSVLLGIGSGQFAAATDFAVGGDPASVFVADVNGDGKPDIVTGNTRTRDVSVLPGSGTGSFGTRLTSNVGPSPYHLAVADVNGDGILDLVATNGDQGSVDVALGLGTGLFAPPTAYTEGAGPMWLSLADITGDGRLDIVTSDLSGTVSVLSNGNAPVLGRVTTVGGVTSVTTSGVGITNGDGHVNAGKNVTLTVNFSSAVTVDSTNGNLTLSLNDGGTATYVGGSGTSALTFSYTVGVTDNTGDLTVTAFHLNGATVQNAGLNAHLDGAPWNASGILQVDTIAPTANISLIGASNRTPGSSLQFAVTFSELVHGIDANSFSLVTTAVTGASILNVAQGVDAAHYTVTVTSGSGLGTIGLSIVGAISDLAGNSLSTQLSSTFNIVANQAPTGSSKTVAMLEDQAYVLQATDFGFSDVNDNRLQAVKFDIVSAYGTLTDNGIEVVANQVVAAADINQGMLIFHANTNLNGGPYFLAKFQVQDDGGTANAGTDLDPTGQVLTFKAISVNDAPVGTSGTVTFLEDQNYTLQLADFGFTDSSDSPANQFLAVKFDIVSAYGTLTDNGAVVSANQFVTAADIRQGKLVFKATSDMNGGPYFLAKFQVQDNGGTANGGIDLDPSGQVLTFKTISVNDAPVGASNTVTMPERQGYVLKTSDFGFADPHDSPANQLLAVKFAIVSAYGTLTDNGVVVTGNQFVSALDISHGKLVFTPAANILGGPYFLAKFQVQDTGGTGNGGIDLDPIGQVLTFKATNVNDAPVGASSTVIIHQNQGYVLKAGDFGFSDPHDSPSNQLLAVKFDIVSAYGTLTDNGVAVTANQFVSVADIVQGKLNFSPSTNILGGPYFLAKFQVQDDGGTANGGIDLDPAGQVLTFKVVNTN